MNLHKNALVTNGQLSITKKQYKIYIGWWSKCNVNTLQKVAVTEVFLYKIFMGS